LPVIQDSFMNRPWEEEPAKAAKILRSKGQEDVAAAIERMTPEKWRNASMIGGLIEAE